VFVNKRLLNHVEYLIVYGSYVGYWVLLVLDKVQGSSNWVTLRGLSGKITYVLPDSIYGYLIFRTSQASQYMHERFSHFIFFLSFWSYFAHNIASEAISRDG